MTYDIKKVIQDSITVKERILEDKEFITNINKIADLCVSCMKNQNKILLAGNGGSAADAQHFAAELVNRFYVDRQALPAIALTTDTSVITSIGNDYGYDQIFARQIEAIGKASDIYIAISTSGNSPNILTSLQKALDKDLITIGLTGQNGGKMEDLCHYCLKAPSTDTPTIQEARLLIEHIICGVIESRAIVK